MVEMTKVVVEGYPSRLPTDSGVNESEKYDGANDNPHRLRRRLLEALCHHLMQTVTHAAQLRRESDVDAVGG